MIRIDCDSVSKRFHISTGRQLLRHHAVSWFRKRESHYFYALRNVSFQVRSGESVAVIGRNGAGKSTLLSLLTKLARPDEGSVTVVGKTAALLELGSGFHPDLTGAENYLLNAALLGFTRKQADDRFEEVIDFAGLAEFVDQPLRTYSSGMVMRLAFSIAVNLDPDILIVDEVLAVGDQAFQAKCFEKVMEFRERGKTIFAVSHAAGMVLKLCERAIWLDAGRLVMDGEINSVLKAYGEYGLESSTVTVGSGV